MAIAIRNVYVHNIFCILLYLVLFVNFISFLIDYEKRHEDSGNPVLLNEILVDYICELCDKILYRATYFISTIKELKVKLGWLGKLVVTLILMIFLIFWIGILGFKVNVSANNYAFFIQVKLFVHRDTVAAANEYGISFYIDCSFKNLLIFLVTIFLFGEIY